METPSRDRVAPAEPAEGTVVNLPGPTPEAREPPSSHRLLHQPQAKSSPTSASSDSFSSYIHRDALIAHQRSSSPRADTDSQELNEPQPGPGSPRSRVQVRLDAVAQESPRGLSTLEFSSPMRPDIRMAGIRESFNAIEARDKDVFGSAVIDVRDLQGQARFTPSRLSSMSRAVSIEVPDMPEQKHNAAWQADVAAAAQRHADASAHEDDGASSRGDGSKGDIRRRRRTRPDEANILAAAYADNAFPDQDTRYQLAEQVGMTVRAVSVWFQNRRQAEKKRSGRYGGSGILGGGLQGEREASMSRDVFETRTPSKLPALPVESTPVQSVSNRRPLGPSTSNASNREGKAKMSIPLDFSNSNKENIPPWVTGSVSDGQSKNLPSTKHDREAPALVSQSFVVDLVRSSSRDLRDLIKPSSTAVSPLDNVLEKRSLPSSKPSITRQVSAPRSSLDEVLRNRAGSLQRSATDSMAHHDRSNDIEDEDASTILPPRKLLSRASSSSSFSLVTTAGGRASIGSLGLTVKPPSAEKPSSLNSRLPPQVIAALQRQGIIASTDAEEQVRQEERNRIWQRMQSSSTGSVETDRVHGSASDERRESEEDEEKTLRMVANRRAAKALAQVRDNALSPTADARKAIHQQRPSHLDLSKSSLSHSVPAAGIRRTLSLDWAAGRDRSMTSALPNRTFSNPSAHAASSLSAFDISLKSQASIPGETATRSTFTEMLETWNGTKQQASKRGSEASPRKRASAKSAVNDENALPGAVNASTSPKRRRLDKASATLGDTSFSDVFTQSERAPGTSMGAPRGMPHHYSFPTGSRLPLAATPRGLASSPYAGAAATMSTRSERVAYRTLASSPSVPTPTRSMSLSQSLRSGFGKHAARSIQSARESRAREHPSCPGSQESSGSHTSDEWVNNLANDSTSRILADRTNTSAERHDDSGFFGSASEDEELPLAATVKHKRAFAKSKSSPIVPRKRPVDRDTDRQAAELLLGLNKGRGRGSQ